MRAPRLSFLTGLIAAIAVAVAAVAIGAGVGYGLSQLSGDDAPALAALPSNTPTTTASAVTATAARTPATGATGASAAPAPARPMRVKVLSTTIRAATTPSGQARHRARVAVRLLVVGGSPPRSLRPIRLVAGSGSVAMDPKARSLAGALLAPVAAGVRVRGELRFETSGAVTDELAGNLRATLRLGGVTRALRLVSTTT